MDGRAPETSSGVRRLNVYQRSMELVEEIHRLTVHLPADERYGLTSQMRRSATSIPMNIAEGYGRKHRGDYTHALSIARGEAFELDTQLEIATRLQLLTTDQTAASQRLCFEVRRMLGAMLQRMNEEGV